MQPVSTRLISSPRPAFSISSRSRFLNSWLWEEMQAPPPQISTSSRLFMTPSLLFFYFDDEFRDRVAVDQVLGDDPAGDLARDVAVDDRRLAFLDDGDDRLVGAEAALAGLGDDDV